MTKKFRYGLVATGLALLCLLTACGKDDTTTAPDDVSPSTTTTGSQATEDTHVHSFGQWEEVSAATCTEAGMQRRTCACGQVETEQIVAKGHEDAIDPALAATCTETGLTEGTHCTVCGEVTLAQQEVPATGHTNVTDEALAATCTATGLTEGTHCATCGTVITAQQEIAALGHQFGEDAYVSNGDATCTVDGTESAKCARCDETDTRTAVGSATGHTNVTNTLQAAGCTTVGWTGGTHCAVCNARTADPELIPALGHSYENGYCTRCWAAEIKTSQGLSYALNEDKLSYTVTGMGTCTDQALVIPEVYNGLPVTAVGEAAFADTAITSAVIQAGVTTIGDSAFRGCAFMTSVTLPDGLEQIGSAAFQGCGNLKTLKVPSSLCTIGMGAFWFCGSMKSVYITDLAAWCTIDFQNMGANPLTVAGNLYLNSKLVTDLVIPDSVTEISDYAFAQCTSLLSVTMGSNVTAVGKQAFYYCTGLTAVVLGENVQSIGANAFEATQLAALTIPASVRSIGQGLTVECSALRVLTVAEGNPVYHSAGNCIIETDTGILLAGCGGSVIPMDGSVTAIGDQAFQGATGLTEITIPVSVESIGSLAFQHCTYLDDLQDNKRFGLTAITFEGTQARWERLEKGDGWIDSAFDFTLTYLDKDVKLELTASDITLSLDNGISADLYDLIVDKAEFDPEKLVITSADDTVILVEGTKVYAVGNSKQGVEVTIAYGDQSVTCLVRSLSVYTYLMNKSDVTLYLDKEGYTSFQLKLANEQGVTAKNLSWNFSADFDTCCSYEWDAEAGILTITAKAVTTNLTNGTFVKVWTVYDGVRYECIVRVRTTA